MTSRRHLLQAAAGVAAVFTLPARVLAQDARLRTVAVLFVGDADDDEPSAQPFFQEMARLGWVEGKTIAYDRHSGKGTRAYLDTMASNAAGSEPDLIFATTSSLASAALRETSTLPVVFAAMADPVAGGLVASLARPGRNATGVYQASGNSAGKRYALVREALPGLKRLGAVFDRAVPRLEERRAMHERAARAAGLQLAAAEFTNFEAVARLFAQYKRDGVTVVEVTPSFALTGRRREVTALAERNDIALVAHRAEWADAGAVLAYGIDIGESYKRAAALAHRILKGAQPAQLAVEQPHRFELVLNQRAALALGIALPKTLLQQARRVVA